MQGGAHFHAHNTDQDGVVTGNTEQGQADNQHTGNGAALEGDIQCRGNAVTCRLGGTRVGAHGYVHADKAGQAGEDGANGETHGRGGVERKHNNKKDDNADRADGGVLAFQVGLSAFLDGALNAHHFLVAQRLREHAKYGICPVAYTQQGTDESDHDFS